VVNRIVLELSGNRGRIPFQGSRRPRGLCMLLPLALSLAILLAGALHFF
jgi:hypothetical protein